MAVKTASKLEEGLIRVNLSEVMRITYFRVKKFF